MFAERLCNLIRKPDATVRISVRFFNVTLNPALNNTSIFHAANIGCQLLAKNFSQFCDDLGKRCPHGAPVRCQIGSSH